MIIRKAAVGDTPAIVRIVHTTVEEVYPYYYLPEIVNFFLKYHNAEAVREDILKENVYVLLDRELIVATGTVNVNTIGRVYVLPEYHGRGYGKAMMDILEAEIAAAHSTVLVDASFPSYDFYLHRGYHPLEYHKYKVENDRIMCYYVMEKKLGKPAEPSPVILDNY